MMSSVSVNELLSGIVVNSKIFAGKPIIIGRYSDMFT